MIPDEPRPVNQELVRHYVPAIYSSFVNHPDPDTEIAKAREHAEKFGSPEWKAAIEEAIARFEAREVKS